MARLACLHVPDFALAATLRAEPNLAGASVVIAAEVGPRAAVVAVSSAAAQRGIRAGLTVTQARAVFADLEVRMPTPATLRAAQAALDDVAYSFSPRCEAAAAGTVYLDLAGSGALFDSETQLATALAARSERIGLLAMIGVAGSKIAAHLAARHGGGVTVVPPNEEWGYLAPLPVGALAPSPALLVTLNRWGLRRVGDLAALPRAAVATRLGPEGLALVRRACGEDEVPLVPRPAPLHFEEGCELDYGIDTLEPLAFVLRGVLDRLIARLAVRGLVCGGLRLSLGLDTRGRDDRTIVVTAPSNDAKALLTLLRLALEAQPPGSAVTEVRLSAIPERLRAAQLDLFRPNGPGPEQLAVTLARLVALCGADRVGAPVVADSHHPEAYEVRSFQGAPGYGGTGDSEKGGGVLRLVLRAMRPPRPLEVHCTRGRLDFVRGDGLSGRVVSCAGPWRLAGEWWHDGAYARDYYDVQLSDGGVYRLFCDRQRWFVAGSYD